MPDARLSVEVGAKIDELQTKMAAAKASVKSFTGYTDAELLKTSQHFQTFGGVNTVMAEKVAATAKASRLAADAQKVLAAEAAASTSGLAAVGVGATKALSALRVMAYVLPGIGIAGIFNLAYEAIGPLISSLDIFNRKLSEAAQNRNALNAAISKGNQEAGKEISTLKILYDAATNVANSTDTRTKAAKELQKQFPETFKNASLEAIKAGELSGAYRQLTVDIIANARAKAIADRIAENTSKILDVDIQKRKIAIAEINELSRVKPYSETRGQAGGAGALGGGMASTRTVTVAEQNAQIKARAAGAQHIADIEKKQLQEQSKFLESFTTTEKLVTAVTETETKKQGKSYADLVKEKQGYIKDLIGLQESFKLSLIQATQEIGDPLAGLQAHGAEKVKKALDAVVGKVEFPPIKVSDVTFSELATAGDIFRETMQYDILPKLGTAFESFFNDVLEHGKFSFAALGQAILKTFESVIASEATQGLLNLLGQKGSKAEGKGSLISSLAGLIGIGGKAGKVAQTASMAETGFSAAGAAAGAVAGSGGLLLPILGGVAAIAGIASLFKKRDRAPDPVYATNGVSTPSTGSSGSQILHVIMTARGRDLVGTLNLEGFYLSRVQNGRG